MYYTVRPAGTRTKREHFLYYAGIINYVLKSIVSLGLVFFGLVAVLTKNYSALALLLLITLWLGVGFNLYNLRTWLPGWRNGSAFTRTLTVTLYMFLIIVTLLVNDPRP